MFISQYSTIKQNVLICLINVKNLQSGHVRNLYKMSTVAGQGGTNYTIISSPVNLCDQPSRSRVLIFWKKCLSVWVQLSELGGPKKIGLFEASIFLPWRIHKMFLNYFDLRPLSVWKVVLFGQILMFLYFFGHSTVRKSQEKSKIFRVGQWGFFEK